MNLVIDIGNTNAKYAVFNGRELVNASVFSNPSLEELKQYCAQYPYVSSAIYCSVAKQNAAFTEFLERQYKCFIEFTTEKAVPLTIKYKTLETLGPDRLAASIGAMQLVPNTNLLVVNMGSCITYEVITSQKEYVGGKISPGAQMRLKALHHFTAKLPLVELTSFNNDIGQSTNDSIAAGIFKGIVYEIEGTIDQLSQRYAHLQTILTGGDAALFVKAIKKPIFTEPFLVLKGLNEVLNHHAN